MANTVDPDGTAHYEQSHLDLQCLQIQLSFVVFSTLWANKYNPNT